METTFNVECTVLGRLQSGTQTRDMVWLTPIPGHTKFQVTQGFKPAEGGTAALRHSNEQLDDPSTNYVIIFSLHFVVLERLRYEIATCKM